MIFRLKRITLKPMEIFETAYRHGLTDDEILHAWNNALHLYDTDVGDETWAR